jgi:hypothetical protein
MLVSLSLASDVLQCQVFYLTQYVMAHNIVRFYTVLYIGDDERWKHARQAWSQFFMTTDFSCYDEMIDEIMDMHLLHKLK